MALILFDGLDNYDNWTTFISSRTSFTAPVNYIWSATGGRFGGSSFVLNNNTATADLGNVYYNNTNLGGDVWTGRAVNVQTIPSELWLVGCGPNVKTTTSLGSEDVDLLVSCSADGTISLYRGRGVRFNGSTLLASTAPGVFLSGRWNWLEVRMKVHPTTGVAEVWLNNQQVLSYSGNTKNSAATTANSMNCIFQGGMAYASGANLLYQDDFYFLDTTGSAPWNTRLGDVRIANIVPVADVPGANTGTQTTGTTHFGVVDELPPNTTDYIMLPGAAGNLERFRASNLTSIPTTVFGVQLCSRLQKSDAGTANIQLQLIANGSNFVANTNTLTTSTSWIVQTGALTLNPETGQSWTTANISGMQIGLTTVA